MSFKSKQANCKQPDETESITRNLICLRLEDSEPERQISGFYGSERQLEFGEETVYSSWDWAGGLITQLKYMQLSV